MKCAKTIEEYMADRIDRRGEDECWPWVGPVNDRGYGNVRREFQGKRSQFSHRVAYQLANPDVDLTGLVVRHLCHNPNCCNPAHLLHGTHADNVQDRVDADRSAKGEDNGRAKLTEKKIRAIRGMLLKDVQVWEIAEVAGVDPAAIRAIRDGKIWRHVA